MRKLRILHLEDDFKNAALVQAILRDGGVCDSAILKDTVDFETSADQREFDIILADYILPSKDGVFALKLAHEKCPEIPFVFMAGFSSEDENFKTSNSITGDYVPSQKNGFALNPSLIRALVEAQKGTTVNRGETSLNDSKEKDRASLESPDEFIWSVDRGGFLTYTSDTVQLLLGYAPSVLLGKNCLEFVHEEDRLELEKLVPEWARQKKGWTGLIVRWKHKNGTYRWFESNAVPIFGRNGQFVGYRGADRDITGRKLAETQLKNAEFKFRRLVEKVPAIVYTAEFGTMGKWHYVSPQIETLLGFTPEEVRQNPGLWFQQVHPDDRARVMEREARSETTGEPIVLEYRMYTRDRRVVWFRDEGVMLPAEGEQPAYMQGVMLDITDLKQAEEVKQKLEDQLRQAQKIEAIGQLAGGVAHDFNNLLMAISGYCELLSLKLTESHPAWKDVLEINKAAQQGASLTRQLLAFSRKQILQPKVLDINAILSNMDNILKRLIREDIDYKSVSAPNIGLIKADPGQVEQVIMNLAVNARDAMPEGGQLTIETGNVYLDKEYASHHVSVTPGSYVVLAVSDTGIGMDEETKLRIFEPFFTTKAEGKGTGLGLSTVYGIVKQSGAYIWVYSELGKGTTFKIYFPRVDEQPQETETQKINVPHRSETILFVDDNESVRSAIAYLLEVRGYNVLQAGNGAEALNVAKNYDAPIHLMITDMVMPQMSGLQLSKQLVKMRQNMKVLYMSGYTEEAVNRHGILHPNLNFLQKPTSMDALLQKIHQILDDSPESPDKKE